MPRGPRSWKGAALAAVVASLAGCGTGLVAARLNAPATGGTEIAPSRSAAVPNLRVTVKEVAFSAELAANSHPVLSGQEQITVAIQFANQGRTPVTLDLSRVRLFVTAEGGQ